MDIEPLTIHGALRVTTEQHRDDRGSFLEWFRDDRFRDAMGHEFHMAQANCSVSAAGVLRGIHYTDVPPGQAKWVTCVAGAVFDVVVDLRVGSPTFARWEAVVLDDDDRRAVYLGEGLGHAFLALTDGATVVYACSNRYDPEHDHEVNPLDPELAIDWPAVGRDGTPLFTVLSAKDRAAPTLASAADAGLLPQFA
ncbi:MAG: dTDP-4-dehydrorhamnose 3,5-epimerase family protein [Ilumatobacteraceae bacterium]